MQKKKKSRMLQMADVNISSTCIFFHKIQFNKATDIYTAKMKLGKEHKDQHHLQGKKKKLSK